MASQTKSNLADVHVVVRSAGERTVDTCLELLRQQAGEATVDVICERPFERALKVTCNRGIAGGRKWTMTLDADVLLREGAVRRLVEAAAAMPESFAQVEGQIYDKVSGTHREAGQRIYRTALLPQVLEAVPEPGVELRPEYATLKRLDAAGHPSRRVALVVGVHDHEQYFTDLLKKAGLHALKHDYLLVPFVRRARSRMEADPDFKVILEGLWMGLQHGRSWLASPSAHADSLARLGMREKPPLRTGEIGYQRVEHWLAEAGPAQQFNEWAKGRRKETAPTRSWTGQFAEQWQARPWWRSGLHLAGSGLMKLGGRMKSLAGPPIDGSAATGPGGRPGNNGNH